ncbi:MAG: DUF4112 domain-containing protein [Kofleriaceae bacterium]
MATTDRAPACSTRAPIVRGEVVVDVEMVRVRRMARVLDRYMLDPILGAVLPGAGDMIGSLLGLYAVSLAIRRRMSPVVIARMLLNLSIDALLGIVPAIGDLFDLAFRANERNVELLLAHAATGGRATWRDWLAVIGAALAFVATVGLAVYAAVAVVRWIA